MIDPMIYRDTNVAVTLTFESKTPESNGFICK